MGAETGAGMRTGVRSYLDHNATAPLRPSVAAAMARALSVGGNPSSVHAEGRRARALVEAARESVALLVGAAPERVVFTSGGTEAGNLALRPGFGGAEVLLVSAGEHACCLHGHGFRAGDVRVLPLEAGGVVDLAALEAVLSAEVARPVLLSLQAANNETGAVQPLAEAARRARAIHPAVTIHSDAVQMAGRLPLDLAALGVDALSLSAHKLGGPTGVGALVLGPGVEPPPPLVRGGGQERGRRGGTENVAGIAGFGAAADLARAALPAETPRLAALRDHFEGELRRLAPAAVVFAAGAPRLPNTSAFAVPGLSAETALIALDLDGVSVSSGSACSSGRVRASHVLAAMGVAPDLARGAIRASFGWNSTDRDVEHLVSAFDRLVSCLYQRRARAA